MTSDDQYSVRFGYRKAEVGFYVMASAARTDELPIFIRGRRFLTMGKLMKAVPLDCVISKADRLETKPVWASGLLLLSLGFDPTLFAKIPPESEWPPRVAA